MAHSLKLETAESAPAGATIGLPKALLGKPTAFFVANITVRVFERWLGSVVMLLPPANYLFGIPYYQLALLNLG